MQRQAGSFLAATMLVLVLLSSGCHVVQHKYSIPFVAEIERTEVIPIGGKRGVTGYRVSWNPVFLTAVAFGGAAALVLVPTWLVLREVRRRKLQQPLTAMVLPDGGVPG